MKKFSIEYHNESIGIETFEKESTPNEQYRLDYNDGRWLIMGKRPDDTKTIATFTENISYSTATVWAIENKSEGPDWVNTEQLQVIAELIARKKQEMESVIIPAEQNIDPGN